MLIIIATVNMISLSSCLLLNQKNYSSEPTIPSFHVLLYSFFFCPLHSTFTACTHFSPVFKYFYTLLSLSIFCVHKLLYIYNNNDLTMANPDGLWVLADFSAVFEILHHTLFSSLLSPLKKFLLSSTLATFPQFLSSSSP